MIDSIFWDMEGIPSIMWISYSDAQKTQSYSFKKIVMTRPSVEVLMCEERTDPSLRMLLMATYQRSKQKGKQQSKEDELSVHYTNLLVTNANFLFTARTYWWRLRPRLVYHKTWSYSLKFYQKKDETNLDGCRHVRNWRECTVQWRPGCCPENLDRLCLG